MTSPKGARRRLWLAALTFTLAATVAGSALAVRTSMNDHRQSVLTAIFPFGVLLQNERLLDPENLDITYQYYLLENLAIGLLRDADENGHYRAGLATSWVRTDDKTWRFTLRDDLRWSDGQRLTIGEVTERLSAFKSSKNRHVTHLRHLVSAEAAAGDERSIILKFDRSVGDGLLHELSLADTAIVPETGKGWRVTTGPYAVESYDPEAKTLSLVANKYCPLVTPETPRRVLLRGLSGPGEMAKVFGEIEADLLYAPTPSFRHDRELLRQRAGQELVGMPTLIHFLYFSAKNSLAASPEDRREVAALLDKALKEVALPGRLVREAQIIPAGYPGRLTHYQVPAVPVSRLRGKVLKIRLNPWFKEATAMTEAIKATAAREGVTLEFTYGAYTSVGDLSDGEIGQVISFAGNQHDPSGTWGFLYSKERGPLGSYAGEVKDLADMAETAPAGSGRGAAFQKLHAATLERAYLVPLFVEPMSIFAKGGLDLSRLSKFDMRMRLYDVRWR